MTSLDLRAIVALRPVRGMSENARRIHQALTVAARQCQPISIRQRHALYAICWRFRRQLSVRLQVKVAIALADAKATAEEFRMNQPAGDSIRASRSIDAGAGGRKRNPLDDLFPETIAK